MHTIDRPLLFVLALLVATPALAQHAQTSAVAVIPGNPLEVWVTDRDNNAVSRVDVAGGRTIRQIQVGVYPRTLAITPDGKTVLVANQRGNVAVDASFVSAFTGSEVRGTVSVIDTASQQVTTTLTDVGVEPYGIAVAPNGKYFAVSAVRSSRITFYELPTLTRLVTFQYLGDTARIPAPFTLKDVDANRDGVADLGDPRGFVIRADSARLYVTHHRSPYVSALDVTLDAQGLPRAVGLAARINTDNGYGLDPIYNPTPVRTVKSQGLPRFLEDIALSPDGSRALIPHMLHNVNHDVGFDFGQVLPGFPGAAVNRSYPALTMIDAAADSYEPGTDRSTRLHSELSDPLRPAGFAAFGPPGKLLGGLLLLGGKGSPVLGGTLTLVAEGVPAGHQGVLLLGTKTSQSAGSLGRLHVAARLRLPLPVSGVIQLAIPNSPQLEGQVQTAQVLVLDASGLPAGLSSGLDIHFSAAAPGQGKLGQRAGHPSRVAFSAAGDHVLMLNRGSEDLFLYDLSGSTLGLRAVFPPRYEFVEREPLDTSTALGDLPLGMALVDDALTVNDDALVYVVNELTRTLSVLRVGWTTGTILQERVQIPLLLEPDLRTFSERLGNEIFEDASRGQTTAPPGTLGEFNNSCGSCHFEGGEDANVWQRLEGPRSTMPTYGGTLLTGLMLWKGERLNMGEAGPMFLEENGGTGELSDREQQALIDFHEKIPVPLSDEIDPATGGLTPLAAVGRDLYFGLNDTGTNPGFRNAGCSNCHPQLYDGEPSLRGFTADFMDPRLTLGDNLAMIDPFCKSLQSNVEVLNLRDVNSGVDIDVDGDGQPDLDRNADGYVDLETYRPMQTDRDLAFRRDDTNGYLCPSDPANPGSPAKTFTRSMGFFSIPTKLGIATSGPFFHDHAAISLRSVLDPAAQALDPRYGSPAYPGEPPFPGLNKLFNGFHDLRGHEQFVPGASKVQQTLKSTDVDADIEALLAFMKSL